MHIDEFDYHLPEEHIAQRPCNKRSDSKLLYLNRKTKEIAHYQFTNLLSLLNENDLLVMNNSKVMPARLYGHKTSGGKVELLIERLLGTHHALAHIKASKSPKPGTTLLLEGHSATLEVGENKQGLFEVTLVHADSFIKVLHAIGHMPLPPYINRDDEAFDEERYQTVYANPEGSVAAPTAGLHFDETLLGAIRDKGIKTTTVTLHVGAGTFQPVRTEDITKHHMHSEWIEVNQTCCDAVNNCRKRGGRVIAVGTTSVRSLESAAQKSETSTLTPYQGETDIFIYPGYTFSVVDALITNFHLPKSSLLMLVSALASRDLIMKAYQSAIQHDYRFFSYGDAMFIV